MYLWRATTLDADDEMLPEALHVALACAGRTGTTAITSNRTDTLMDLISGIGPTASGWLTPERTVRHRGDLWGQTSTRLGCASLGRGRAEAPGARLGRVPTERRCVLLRRTGRSLRNAGPHGYRLAIHRVLVARAMHPLVRLLPLCS
jgi:hypothetical protein